MAVDDRPSFNETRAELMQLTSDLSDLVERLTERIKTIREETADDER